MLRLSSPWSLVRLILSTILVSLILYLCPVAAQDPAPYTYTTLTFPLTAQTMDPYAFMLPASITNSRTIAARPYNFGGPSMLRDPGGRTTLVQCVPDKGTSIQGLSTTGLAVGSCGLNEPPYGMAFLRTRNGEYQEIAYPGALFTDARGVNDQGDVVGWYFNENETDQPNQMDFYAFLYKNGQYQRLYGPRPNDIIFPSAINRNGDIVGGVYYGMTPEWRYTPRGFLLKDGQLTWLDTNPSGIGASNPWARSINNMGQIVVTDFGDSYLWQEGTFHKLPPIPGDYQYADIHAEGLNDHGDIVGWYVGYKAGQSDYRGFVATASPAPLWQKFLQISRVR